MKILLVDDEEEFVSALAERIALRGILVEWVSNPEEAVDKVSDNCFDLAVLDVNMPGLNGFELKKKLQHKCPAMKFFFLTGHGATEDDHRADVNGKENVCLLKPIPLENLIRKITAVLS